MEVKQASTLKIRNPEVSDAADIWNLVKSCPPLDLNSSYLYLLLCEHFSKTCLVIEDDGKITGFVSAYIPPEKTDTLFVWQIAVDASLRGRGCARKLLRHLLEQEICRNIKLMDLTISPSNEASRALFKSFAEEMDANFTEDVMFHKDDFPEGESHEEEKLCRIGPLNK